MATDGFLFLVPGFFFMQVFQVFQVRWVSNRISIVVSLIVFVIFFGVVFCFAPAWPLRFFVLILILGWSTTTAVSHARILGSDSRPIDSSSGCGIALGSCPVPCSI